MNDIQFLVKIKEYIESNEVFIEDTRGHCRSLNELIEANEMPDLYLEIVEKIKAAEQKRILDEVSADELCDDPPVTHKLGP